MAVLVGRSLGRNPSGDRNKAQNVGIEPDMMRGFMGRQFRTGQELHRTRSFLRRRVATEFRASRGK